MSTPQPFYDTSSFDTVAQVSPVEMAAAVVNFVPVSMLEEQVKELAAVNKESMATSMAIATGCGMAQLTEHPQSVADALLFFEKADCDRTVAFQRAKRLLRDLFVIRCGWKMTKNQFELAIDAHFGMHQTDLIRAQLLLSLSKINPIARGRGRRRGMRTSDLNRMD